MDDFEDILPVEEEGEGEQAAQEGGWNRAFIILVAALTGLLVMAAGAFVAWRVFIAPQRRADIESRSQATFATNTALAVAAAANQTAAASTSAPTDTPIPTDTPVPAETVTPRPPTDTPEPESTATLPSETPEGAEVAGAVESVGMPDTGVGVLAGAALGGGLAFLLFLVRRLRKVA
jgi:hypothetical protein